MSRGFVDPFTNVVNVTAYDMRRQFVAPWLGLPRNYLASFLHETTHHWCLDSPVGIALSALRMRARVNAHRWRRATDDFYKRSDLLFDALTDFLRTDSALRFMLPLAEGLALFCEHDALPSDSPIISRPMLAAAVLFRSKEGESRDTDARAAELLRTLPDALIDARLSDAHRHRKADLLIQRLDAVRDPYLAGYMTVKNMHRISLDRSNRLVDSDLFMSYSRSFFFDDWDLVDLLLDSSLSDTQVTASVFEYFQRRLAAHYNSTSNAVVEEFERDGEAARMDECHFEEGSIDLTIRSHPIACRNTARAKSRLASLLRSLFVEDPRDAAEKALQAIHLATFSLRGTLTLGHADFAARVTEGQMLHLVDRLDDRIPFFARRAPDTLKGPWQGKLTVDMVFDFTSPGLVMFLSRDGALVAAQYLGSDRKVPPHFSSSLIDRERRLAAQAAAEQALHELLKNDTSAVITGHLDEVQQQLNAVYLPRALLFVPDDQFAEAAEKMKEDGWLGLHGATVGHVADAAAVGLMASLRLINRDLHGVDWAFGSAATSTHELNRWARTALGFEPFFCKGDIVFFSLI